MTTETGSRETGPCIFAGCVSRERHTHGGFPGGYDNPADQQGPPIYFTDEPAAGLRDYHGAPLKSKHAYARSFDAVQRSLAETMDDGPMVTSASVSDFIDDLHSRGYEVVMCQCSIAGDNMPPCPAPR